MAYKRLTCVAERAAIGNGNRAGTSVDSRYVRIGSHTGCLGKNNRPNTQPWPSVCEDSLTHHAIHWQQSALFTNQLPTT